MAKNRRNKPAFQQKPNNGGNNDRGSGGGSPTSIPPRPAVTAKVQVDKDEFERLLKESQEYVELLKDEKLYIDNYKKSAQEKIDEELAKFKSENIDHLNAEKDALTSDLEELSTKKEIAQADLEALAAATKEEEKKKRALIQSAEQEAEAAKATILALAHEKAEQMADERNAEKQTELEAMEKKLEREKRRLEREDKVLEEDRQAFHDERSKYPHKNALEHLEALIAQKDETIASYMEEIRNMSIRLTELNIQQVRLEGKTLESLDRENEELNKDLTRLRKELEKKSIESDQAKTEWLKKEDEKNERIMILQSDNENLKMDKRELTQAKAQVATLRALNDHLRQELESNKTALESRTGDSCPALTAEDELAKKDKTKAALDKSSIKPIERLVDLVLHVRNFAANSTKEESKRLYYEENDIRAFIAGLAVSRLSILQGLSGTGKSSLPRIFMEAISGEHNLIPVESSWRDRNELLGYYNDFNKRFNAKDFTIALYRSGLEEYRDIPTFITLDEMNLARIEYYFSDFLSVLEEPDQAKWRINLVASDLRTLPNELKEEIREDLKKNPSLWNIWDRLEKIRLGDRSASVSDEDRNVLMDKLSDMGLLTGAKNLIDGKTIIVPNNVWFIGTANRDESTFEITDKVYDRAQVLSLNKKADRASDYKGTPVPCFISATKLNNLLNKAKTTLSASDANKVQEELENLNMHLEEFDTAFGNRIFNQAKEFTAVYLAAGGTSINEALDYQISTKIIRKVLDSNRKKELKDLSDEMVKRGYTKSKAVLEKRLKDLES